MVPILAICCIAAIQSQRADGSSPEMDRKIHRARHRRVPTCQTSRIRRKTTAALSIKNIVDSSVHGRPWNGGYGDNLTPEPAPNPLMMELPPPSIGEDQKVCPRTYDVTGIDHDGFMSADFFYIRRRNAGSTTDYEADFVVP